MFNWFLLAVAIGAEVIATSALKYSKGFTLFLPSALVLVGYSIAFYLMSLTFRTIPVGVVYAVWSGVGVSIITCVGWFVFGEKLSPPVLFGILLIVIGVIVVQIFSSGSN